MGSTREVSFLRNSLLSIDLLPDFIIKTLFFVIIRPVFLCDLTDHSAWISCCADVVRNILCHHTSRTDHCVISNLHSRQDHTASPDPYIISDGNRYPILVSGIPAVRMDGMSCSINSYVWSEKHIFPDGDLSYIQHNTACICIKVFSQCDMAAVFTEIGRAHV